MAFQLSEGFVRFLWWGTSFTGGGGGGGGTIFTSDKVWGDNIHGGTFFTPTPALPDAKIGAIAPILHPYSPLYQHPAFASVDPRSVTCSPICFLSLLS